MRAWACDARRPASGGPPVNELSSVLRRDRLVLTSLEQRDLAAAPGGREQLLRSLYGVILYHAGSDEDAISAAIIAALEAIDAWDHTRASLTTLAWTRIRDAVMAEEAGRGRMLTVTRATEGKRRRVQAVASRLEQELRRTPTVEELAAELLWAPHLVERYLAQQPVAQLDELAASVAVDDMADQAVAAADVAALLSRLPARHPARAVIVAKYGLGGQPPMTVAETAALLGCSRATVHRHLAYALRVMRVRP